MSVPKSASLLRLVIHSAALAIPVLFAFNAYSEPTVTVISPKSGATGGSPVFYEAFATSPGCDKGIAAMRIYSAPGVDAFDVDGAHIETFIPLSPGNYSTTVQAWDNCGGVGKTAVPLTVSDKAGVSVYLPTQGAAYWPVHVAASAESPECSAGISAIRIYAAPGVSPYTIDANKLDADVTLPPGNHNLTVQAWDNCGNVFKYPLAESVFSSSDAYLYASGTGSIAEIEINSDGSLRNPNGSGSPPEFSAQSASVLAVDPGGWFVYATSDAGIYGFQIDRSNGALVAMPGSPFRFNIDQLGDQGPSTILMDPAGNFVYVGYHGGGGGAATAGVATYRIERSSGELTWTGFALYFGSESSGFGGLDSPTTDSTGRYFYCSCGKPTLQLREYAVDANNGFLTAAPGSPFQFVGSPASTGKYLYLGATKNPSEGDVLGLAVNYSNGTVTQLPGSPFSAGSPGWPITPLWADWQNRFLWGLEFQNQTAASNGLQAFTINSSTGAVAPSGSFMNFPLLLFFDLVEDHSGKYVFTGMTRNGSNSGPDLASWSIAPDGTWKEINSLDISSGVVSSIAVAPKNPQ